MRPLDNPLKPTGGLAILRGNLAPEGCVVKLAGHERRHHAGPARVFEGEEAAMDAATHGGIKPGDVVIIRNEGPAGGPGMREMLAVTAAINGAGPGRGRRAAHRRALLAARRTASWPATSRPEAVRGGPIAAVQRRRHRHDRRRRRRIDVDLADDEIAERVAAYEPPPNTDVTGVLAKYAKLVGSASQGAVTV